MLMPSPLTQPLCHEGCTSSTAGPNTHVDPDVAVALCHESSRQTYTRQLPIQTTLELERGLINKRIFCSSLMCLKYVALSRRSCNRVVEFIQNLIIQQPYPTTTKMPTYPHDSGISSTVFLRRVTILSLPPAFIILLIHGVGSSWAFPALGILPLAVSAMFGALLLHRDRVAALGSPIQALTPENIFYADSSLAIWYLAFLIPTWAVLHRPWQHEMVILGTYGSVFLMINLSVSPIPSPFTMALLLILAILAAYISTSLPPRLCISSRLDKPRSSRLLQNTPHSMRDTGTTLRKWRRETRGQFRFIKLFLF